jgi:O-antigen ligase
MPSWLKIATWLLLASLATLGFKKPTLWLVFNWNDLFLMASLVAFSIAAIRKEITVSVPRTLVKAFLLGLATIGIGSLISFFAFNVTAPIAPMEYARIVASLAICLEIVILGRAQSTFWKKALIAVTFPTLIFMGLMYAPASIRAFVMDDSQGRFSGLLFDPNYFASFMILPAFIWSWFTASNFFKRRWLLGVLSLIGCILSCGLILWSGSRGGILGLALGLITLIIMTVRKLSLQQAAVLIMLILVGVGGFWLLMPQSAKNHMAMRLDNLIHHSDQGTTLQLGAKQNRISIWKSAIGEIKKNPLGYGPGYHQTANLIGDEHDEHRVAHNTILQMILTGGWLLLVLCMIGLGWMVTDAWHAAIPFGPWHFIFAAGIALAGVGCFLDSLWSRWVWVTLGLLIVLRHTKNP